MDVYYCSMIQYMPNSDYSGYDKALSHAIIFLWNQHKFQGAFAG